MRFAPKIYLVLSLLLCLCHGAPPKEVGTSSNRSNYHRFTEAEDKFIIEELLSFSGTSPNLFSQPFWDNISKNHLEKFKEHTPGFPCERSGMSLRKHFSDYLLPNHPDAKVKVPESLFEKFPQLQERLKNPDTRPTFTAQENKFIVDELLEESCTSPWAISWWNKIQKKHDENRRNKVPGFENERTPGTLRTHVRNMRKRDLLPTGVLKKLRVYNKGGSSSRSTPPSGTTGSQETREEQDDDEWAADMVLDLAAVGTSSNRRNYHWFTEAEDKFIIEELLRFSGTAPHLFSQPFWDNISKNHREKFKGHTAGFPCERSAMSLRKHFTDYLLPNHPDANVKVPESLFEKFPQLNERIKNPDHRPTFTAQENKFIVDELLEESCTSPYSISCWNKIQKKHDENRRNNVPGFENERSIASLRTHMRNMKTRDLLPSGVVKKLRAYNKVRRRSKLTPPSGETESQETSEEQDDDEWAADMVLDLAAND